MNDWEKFVAGLFAFGATVFTGWLYVETRRELYRAASRNDLPGTLGWAIAHGAAMQSLRASIKELQRLLK
jgi:hypothetical protein